MIEHMQMRGLWQAHWLIVNGATGERRVTADKAILSQVHHGKDPAIRAFAEKLRAKHGIVAPGFSWINEGGAA